MSDPRLNGQHLDVARRDQYDATVDDMLDDRGPLTSVADPLVRSSQVHRIIVRREVPPPGGTYALENLADGNLHSLKVGINTIGRYMENDLVLTPNPISRRHCIVLVHATGGCEVYDTASRHGTLVNHRRIIGRVDLLPGDVLGLCDYRFLVAWTGPNGEVLPSREEPDTVYERLSATD